MVSNHNKLVKNLKVTKTILNKKAVKTQEQILPPPPTTHKALIAFFDNFVKLNVSKKLEKIERERNIYGNNT
jgi:hypothetical protein